MWNSIGYRTAANHFFVLRSGRAFWSSSDASQDSEEPEVRIVETAADAAGKGEVALPPQILVPMPEHPVFPGYSSVVALTKEQYEILKPASKVFTTVVRNDDLV